MLTLLLSLAVSAAPRLDIPSGGFSVEREGEEVVVVSVIPDLPAAKARLEVGAVIVSIQLPRSFVKLPLAKMSDEDLIDALTPSFFEPLRLFARQKGNPRVFISRTDKPPQPFFPQLPLSEERLARLTYQERMVYDRELGLKTMQEAARKK